MTTAAIIILTAMVSGSAMFLFGCIWACRERDDEPDCGSEI